MIEEFAAAKINLALHVLGRRADGYHELDSVVAFADVGDTLTLEPAAETTFSSNIILPKSLAPECKQICAVCLPTVSQLA